MHKGFIKIAALLGALGVALGAFGAHGLKKLVPPETVSTFETGVRYQMYHVFALLIVGMLFSFGNAKLLKAAGYCFLAGMLLFSGSLYLLTFLKATASVGLGGFGIITPFGGVFFIVGWLLLMASIRKAG